MEQPKALSPEPQGEIAVAITVQSQVGDKRTIVMQTYLPRDTHVKEFHKTLDKLTRAVDRQEAKANLEQAKRHLEQVTETLAKLEADYTRIDERNATEWKVKGKKGEPQLNQTELAAKGTAHTNIKEYRNQIDKAKAQIKEYEAEIAKDD